MNQFRGTGVALVTPFNEDSSVDYAALEKLIEHVIANGVNYLVALGTTAETPTLTAEEKKQVLSFIVEKCNKRIPVVCGIGGNNTVEVMQQVKEYDLSGVDGILSVVPYYNKPTQDGIYQHFKAIANSTTKPIILYNVPGRTVANMLPATALKLAHEFRHIVAIKEASGNFSQVMDLVRGRPNHFAILSGDDDLVMPQIALGAEGVISVAANCFTKDFTDMVDMALDGNFDGAKNMQYRLIEGMRLLFVDGNPAGAKYVLNQLGICKNILRLPMTPVTDDTAQKFKAWL